MTTASLDYIVKNYLLKKGYPLHWYMQFMVYAADCLRDITFDDLRVINTKILPVNQNINTAELPEDYQDCQGRVDRFPTPVGCVVCV